MLCGLNNKGNLPAEREEKSRFEKNEESHIVLMFKFDSFLNNFEQVKVIVLTRCSCQDVSFFWEKPLASKSSLQHKGKNKRENVAFASKYTRMRDGMILVECMSGFVRTGVTTGLLYIEIYSFFVASGNPVSLNSSNSYLSPCGVPSINPGDNVPDRQFSRRFREL